jgi:hypothetical protein
MKYTLTLAADPAKAPAPGSPEEGRFFQAFFAFNQEIEDKGVYLGGAAAGRLHGDHHPGGRRPGECDRWAVCRDQGADCRVLPAGVCRSG